MIQLPAHCRYAEPADADQLAILANIAGEGLPLYLWQTMAEAGQSPWDVGRARAQREAGSFSYRNAILRLHSDAIVACLIGYPLDDSPAPTDLSGMPPMFVPLQQLEDMVPGTWYINVVATHEAHRGKGYGRELLALADLQCRDLGKRGLSLIVANTNEGALALYRRTGYRELARRPMVKERWQSPGTEWVLMRRDS